MTGWLAQSDRLLSRVGDSRTAQWLALLAVILLAIGLRMFKLGFWSFWGDEIITVNRALGLFQEGGATPTVSLILTKLTFSAIGVSEWSARIVPALAGIATIPILYFLVREIFNTGSALVASLLLAVSPWHIYWSQNARFYSLLLAFFTVALVLFYLGLERNRMIYWVGAFIFLGLAVLERLTALLFVPVIGVYVVLLFSGWLGRPQGLTFKNISIFSAVGLVPSLYLILRNPSVREPSAWLRAFGWLNTDPIWIVSGVVYYVGVPAIVAAVVGSIYLIRSRSRPGMLFTLGAVLPLVITAAVSLIQYAANRYVFVSLTSWLVLAGFAVYELFATSRAGGARLLAAGLLLVVVLSPLSEDVLYFAYQNGNRDNWKAAFAFVERNRQDDDRVVSGNPAVGRYYISEGVSGMGQLEESDLEAISSRTWFVEDMTAPQKYPHVHRWLLRRARLVREFDVQVRARVFEMNVYLYEPDPSAASSQP